MKRMVPLQDFMEQVLLRMIGQIIYGRNWLQRHREVLWKHSFRQSMTICIATARVLFLHVQQMSVNRV